MINVNRQRRKGLIFNCSIKVATCYRCGLLFEELFRRHLRNNHLGDPTMRAANDRRDRDQKKRRSAQINNTFRHITCEEEGSAFDCFIAPPEEESSNGLLLFLKVKTALIFRFSTAAAAAVVGPFK